jgi:hypothetical protein
LRAYLQDLPNKKYKAMHFLEYYYLNIIKYDLINRFNYKNIKEILGNHSSMTYSFIHCMKNHLVDDILLNFPEDRNLFQEIYNKIIDTVNWVTIFGSFIADSAYSHILIGNFFTDNNTDTLIMDNLSTCDGSYYFVDKVCVSTDSLFTKNYLTTNIFNYNSKDKIKIYPKIITDVVNIENSNTEPYSIEITDMLGNLFFSKRNILRDNFIIDCSNFNPQILLIKINSNKYNYINKIVKQ